MEKTNSKKKQYLLGIVLSLVYFSNYMCRSTFPSTINCFVEEYSITHSEAGLVITFFFIAYAIGQLINCFFIKKYNKRISITIPALGMGVMCLLTFFKFDFKYYKFIWFALGIFSSFIWMSIVKLISVNTSDNISKSIIAILSFALGIGSALTYLITSILTHFNVFRYIFLISSVLMIISAIIFFFFIKNYSYSPKTEKELNDNGGLFIEKMPSPKLSIFFIFIIIILSPVAALATDSLITWVPTILRDEFDLNNSLSIFVGLFLPIIRSFGSIINNFLKRKGLGYLLIVNFMMVISITSLAFIIYALNNIVLALMIIFALLAYLPFACITSVFTALYPLQLKNYYDSGFLSAMFGTAAYVGSALSSYLVPLFVERTSWNSLFLLFISGAGFILIISLSIYLIFRHKEKYKLFI